MADQVLAAAASGRAPASCIANGLGKGGLPVVILTHGSGAVCEIYLHGATVTRFTSCGGKEVLWLSESAVFDGKKAIRGGIPVVFPMFGPTADAKVGGQNGMTQHGFARTATWSLDGASTRILDSGDPQAVLTLGDTAATRALWPHAFALTYTVVLTATALHAELKIANRDGPEAAAPFAPQCLLHTYLATPDVQRVMVYGLEESTYVDKLAESTEPKAEAMPAIRFRGETDRVYLGPSRRAQPLTLRPGARLDVHAVVLDANDTISNEFEPDVVVWNPHVDKARAMGDFDDDGWTAMCCLEPGVVNADRPAVDTGGSLVLSQTLTPDLD